MAVFGFLLRQETVKCSLSFFFFWEVDVHVSYFPFKRSGAWGFENFSRSPFNSQLLRIIMHHYCSQSQHCKLYLCGLAQKICLLMIISVSKSVHREWGKGHRRTKRCIQEVHVKLTFAMTIGVVMVYVMIDSCQPNKFHKDIFVVSTPNLSTMWYSWRYAFQIL